MSKTITISLQTLHNLYSKFLNKCILPYLPQNIQNQINILINFKSPVDVYKHLTNLINNFGQHDQVNKQDQFDSLLSKSPQKTSMNGSNHKIIRNSAQKIDKIDTKNRYQSIQRSQKSSPNKKGLKILNSSLNFQDVIMQNQQKNSTGQLKPVNRSHNLINLKSPNANSKKDSQIQKINQILAKKSSHDSVSSLNINNTFLYKIKKQTDSEIKTTQFSHNIKQTASEKGKQTKTNSIQRINNLLSPPIIPKNDSSNLNTNQILKPYHVYSPKIQNNFGHASQNLNQYNNITNKSNSTKNNIKNVIKNLQQIFRQNQKKIQRYDKVYTVPPSSTSSFGNNIVGGTYNSNNYLNLGGVIKKY